MAIEPKASPGSFTIKELVFYVAVALLIGFGSGVGAAGLFTGRPAASARGGPAESAAAASAPAEAARIDVSTEGRPSWGPDDAAVTIVEFTDYQCPFCARYVATTYPALKELYEQKVRYVVRNFPIGSIHPQAQKAAEAAECAYDAGAFWEYHARLFANQSELDVESLKRHAAEIGLPAEPFADCLDSGRKTETVRNDLRDGLGYGIQGTPTFFINGRPLAGAQPLELFESIIEAELREPGSATGAVR